MQLASLLVCVLLFSGGSVLGQRLAFVTGTGVGATADEKLRTLLVSAGFAVTVFYGDADDAASLTNAFSPNFHDCVLISSTTNSVDIRNKVPSFSSSSQGIAFWETQFLVRNDFGLMTDCSSTSGRLDRGTIVSQHPVPLSAGLDQVPTSFQQSSSTNLRAVALLGNFTADAQLVSTTSEVNHLCIIVAEPGSTRVGSDSSAIQGRRISTQCAFDFLGDFISAQGSSLLVSAVRYACDINDAPTISSGPSTISTLVLTSSNASPIVWTLDEILSAAGYADADSVNYTVLRGAIVFTSAVQATGGIWEVSLDGQGSAWETVPSGSQFGMKLKSKPDASEVGLPGGVGPSPLIRFRENVSAPLWEGTADLFVRAWDLSNPYSGVKNSHGSTVLLSALGATGSTHAFSSNLFTGRVVVSLPVLDPLSVRVRMTQSALFSTYNESIWIVAVEVASFFESPSTEGSVSVVRSVSGSTIVTADIDGNGDGCRAYRAAQRLLTTSATTLEALGVSGLTGLVLLELGSGIDEQACQNALSSATSAIATASMTASSTTASSTGAVSRITTSAGIISSTITSTSTANAAVSGAFVSAEDSFIIFWIVLAIGLALILALLVIGIFYRRHNQVRHETETLQSESVAVGASRFEEPSGEYTSFSRPSEYRNVQGILAQSGVIPDDIGLKDKTNLASSSSESDESQAIEGSDTRHYINVPHVQQKSMLRKQTKAKKPSSVKRGPAPGEDSHYVNVPRQQRHKAGESPTARNEPSLKEQVEDSHYKSITAAAEEAKNNSSVD